MAQESNPFFVQPMGDITQGLQGLGTAIGGAYQMSQARSEAERLQDLQMQAAQIYQSGDMEALRQFRLQNPELGAALAEEIGFRSEETKTNYTNSLMRALTEPESIPKIVAARQAYLKAQGQTPEETGLTDSAMEQYAADPEGFMESLELDLMLLDPDKYEQYKSFTAEPEVDDDSTSDIKNFNRYLELKKTDPEAAEAFGRSQGYITDPTGTGVSKQKTAAFRVRDPETGEVGVAVGVFDPSSGTLTTQTATFEDYQIVSTLGETAMEQTEREIEQTRQEKIVTGAEEEAASLITRGVLAAESTAPLRRAIELIEFVPTGGFDAAALKAKQMFGIESADEGELSNMLGKAVLSQLRETFGAAFTEREGDRLNDIEASFGKSPEANKRLLEQTLAIAENTAQRALKAAEERGDTRMVEDIQGLLDFSLTPEPETVTETTDQNPVIGTKAAYDSLTSGALYVNQTTGKLMRKP